MSDRFPPLRPPAPTGRKPTARTQVVNFLGMADLCLLAALLFSLGLALI